MKAARFIPFSSEAGVPGLPDPIVHEYCELGQHRLVYQGKVGNWEVYSEICYMKFTKPDMLVAATTEHYFGELPEIFVIMALKEHMDQDKELKEVSGDLVTTIPED